jgi:hypothetical protein
MKSSFWIESLCVGLASKTATSDVRRSSVARQEALAHEMVLRLGARPTRLWADWYDVAEAFAPHMQS